MIDSYARNLYWIDSGLDRIEVVSLSNSRTRKVLFNSELSQPQGLALDVFNGLVNRMIIHSIHCICQLKVQILQGRKHC